MAALVNWIAQAPRWVMTLVFMGLFVWSLLLTPLLYFLIHECCKAFERRSMWSTCFLLLNALVGLLLCVLFLIVAVHTMQIRFYMSGVVASAVSVAWGFILRRTNRE